MHPRAMVRLGVVALVAIAGRGETVRAQGARSAVPTIALADYAANLRERAAINDRRIEEMRLATEAARAKCPRVPVTWTSAPGAPADSVTVMVALTDSLSRPVAGILRDRQRRGSTDSLGVAALKVAAEAFGRDTLVVQAIGYTASRVPLPARSGFDGRTDVPFCPIPLVLNQIVSVNQRGGERELVLGESASPLPRLWTYERGLVAIRGRFLTLERRLLPADSQLVARGIPSGVPVNAKVSVAERVLVPPTEGSVHETFLIEAWHCRTGLPQARCEVTLIDALYPLHASFDGGALQVWMSRHDITPEGPVRRYWMLELPIDGGAPSWQVGAAPPPSP